jgi:UDP-glucuronate decarboxylase
MDKNDGRVVSNFIIQALENRPITIYGDGNQTRSFCYVDDLIKALYILMNQNVSIGPINLGNPGEFTINQLAKKVLELTNSKSNIIYKELPQDDPVQRKPDINLAKEILNWKPLINLDQGLSKTIHYFISINKRK